MSWKQDLINAQVSVNRSVWAINTDLSGKTGEHCTFKNDKERHDYIIRETESATKDLETALKKIYKIKETEYQHEKNTSLINNE